MVISENKISNRYFFLLLLIIFSYSSIFFWMQTLFVYKLKIDSQLYLNAFIFDIINYQIPSYIKTQYLFNLNTFMIFLLFFFKYSIFKYNGKLDFKFNMFSFTGSESFEEKMIKTAKLPFLIMIDSIKLTTLMIIVKFNFFTILFAYSSFNNCHSQCNNAYNASLTIIEKIPHYSFNDITDYLKVISMLFIIIFVYRFIIVFKKYIEISFK